MAHVRWTPWLLALLPAAPLPDLLPLGHRGVTHHLVLEDHDAFREYRLVAGPMSGFHGLETLEAGTPFDFSSKYGTKVYALPLDAPLPKDSPHLGTDPEDWPDECLVGEIPVRETKGVPAVSHVGRILTILRIEELTEEALVLAVVSEQRWDRSGKPMGRSSLPILVVLALVGLAGVVHLARSRPRAPTEEA